ncbi:MAG: phosphoenolpyruvate-utilizing N-terminal domain-containing protein, partial [Candidatus Cloacimonadaceae bacterium]|nr:phosphoenolpyruvate-utilizing N-terminal domain-containing protein [Candidatus Cloacimonadaceae bacterium]
MTTINGTTINAGVFIGPARIITQKQYHIAIKNITEEDISSEIIMLEQALNRAENEIKSILDSSSLGPKDKDIIETHLLILRDPDIVEKITSKITDNLHSAAHAVHQTFEAVITHFQNLENDFFALRVGDYKDVSHRLLGSLLGESSEEILHPDTTEVIICREISPSRVTSLARMGYKAYISETGSYNSHSSILTRALDLVAIT